MDYSYTYQYKSDLYIACEQRDVPVIHNILNYHAKNKTYPRWSIVDNKSAYDILDEDEEVKQIFVDIGIVVDKKKRVTKRPYHAHRCSPICSCLDETLFFPRPLQVIY